MSTWRIVRLSLEHCTGALLIGVMFAGTDYCFSLLFPNGTVLWWIGKIEFVLAVLTPTALGIIFIGSIVRIVYDVVVSLWRGGTSVNGQILLA
jgi:hypothetical protein